VLAPKYWKLLVGYLYRIWGDKAQRVLCGRVYLRKPMHRGFRALGLSWAFIRDSACLIGFVTFDGFTGFESRPKPICRLPNVPWPSRSWELQS
jgi:hypothetical protein